MTTIPTGNAPEDASSSRLAFKPPKALSLIGGEQQACLMAISPEYIEFQALIMKAINDGTLKELE